jgi:cell division inhibitor SulA
MWAVDSEETGVLQPRGKEYYDCKALERMVKAVQAGRKMCVCTWTAEEQG